MLEPPVCRKHGCFPRLGLHFARWRKLRQRYVACRACAARSSLKATSRRGRNARRSRSNDWLTLTSVV
eukprot:7401552-Heterocapsa_arctica.AAC.1